MSTSESATPASSESITAPVGQPKPSAAPVPPSQPPTKTSVVPGTTTASASAPVLKLPAVVPTRVPSAPMEVRKPPAMLPPVHVTSTAMPTPAQMATTKAKGKRSKKAQQPQVSMATASSSGRSGGGEIIGENTGRWTAEEHRLFLQGLEQHGKGWKKIASLIKSRTVVQIRTHAQKYFQKLAKARQNGEEGDVSMDARGGPTSVHLLGNYSTSGVSTAGKRRRQTTGTKRKAISSVIISAQREGKRLQAEAIAAGLSCPQPPLPSVAPALAPFLLPTSHPNSAHGGISGPALEDSLFRFLTPAPVTASDNPVQVNDVARQAGANPITLPTDNPSSAPSTAGEVSPTGVTDVPIFPSWTDAKDMPSWYAKGADVDVLLDAADGLDWLADTGDLHETYDPPAHVVNAKRAAAAAAAEKDADDFMKGSSSNNLEASANSSGDVQNLPSLFADHEPDAAKKAKLTLPSTMSGTGIDETLNVFDTPMDEHAFVSALLENNGESSTSLPNLQ